MRKVVRYGEVQSIKVPALVILWRSRKAMGMGFVVWKGS
jgi:hypothetical protein